jgi:polysaccharide biosynthesis/export protein
VQLSNYNVYNAPESRICVAAAQLEYICRRLLMLIACAAISLLCGCFNAAGSLPQADRQIAELSKAAPLQNSYDNFGPSFATQRALLAFDSTPQAVYTIGPGDSITVTVWAHPELSGKHVVGPDGNIQLPFVGSVRVGDLTADGAGDKLNRALSDQYVGAVATVQIDDYTDNQVTVLGHVSNPGVQRFSADPTLLEALARAGVPATQSNTDSGRRAEGFTRCAIFRGHDSVVWIDLRPLLRGDSLALNLRLHRNDLIYVPDSNDDLVYVMGQVSKPGAYELSANMSFLDALALAGGPNDNAQPGKIVLARPRQHLQQVIDLKKFLKGEGDTNYALEQGDIIYVPKSGIAAVGYVLTQISPLTQSMLFAAALF